MRFKSARKKIVSRSHPILTRGFRARMGIDLIDCSSVPDVELKYLLACRHYGINFSQLTPLTSEHRVGVAMAMLQTFYCEGSPALLQSGNGSEFRNTVQKVEGILKLFSDDEMSEAIETMKQLWP